MASNIGLTVEAKKSLEGTELTQSQASSTQPRVSGLSEAVASQNNNGSKSHDSEFMSDKIVEKLMPYFPELALAYIEYLKAIMSKKEVGNGSSANSQQQPGELTIVVDSLSQSKGASATPSSDTNNTNAAFNQYFQSKAKLMHQKLELIEKERKNRFDYSGKYHTAPNQQNPSSKTAETTETVGSVNTIPHTISNRLGEDLKDNVENETKGGQEQKASSEASTMKVFTFNFQHPGTMDLITTTIGQLLALEHMIETAKVSDDFNFNQFQRAMLDHQSIRSGIIFQYFAADMSKSNNETLMQSVIESNVAQYGNNDSYMNLLLQNYRNVQLQNQVGFPQFLEIAFKEGITPERVWQLIGSLGHPLEPCTSTMLLYFLVHEIDLKVVQEIVAKPGCQAFRMCNSARFDELVPAIILKKFKLENFDEILLDYYGRNLALLAAGVSPNIVIEVSRNEILRTCSNDILEELLKCNLPVKELIQLVNKFKPNSFHNEYLNLIIPCIRHGIPMETIEETLKLNLHMYYIPFGSSENQAFYKDKPLIVHLLKEISVQMLHELKGKDENSFDIAGYFSDVIRMNLSLKEMIQFVRLRLYRDDAYSYGHKKEVYILLSKGVTATELQSLAKRHLQRLLLLDKELDLSKSEVFNIQLDDIDVDSDYNIGSFENEIGPVQQKVKFIKAIFVKLPRPEAIKFLTDTFPRLLPHQIAGLNLGLDMKQVMDARCTDLFIRLMKDKKYSWEDLADLEDSQLEVLSDRGLVKGENLDKALRRNPKVISLEQMNSSREWWTDLHAMAVTICGRKFSEIAGKTGEQLMAMLALPVAKRKAAVGHSLSSPVLYSSNALAVGMGAASPLNNSVAPGTPEMAGARGNSEVSVNSGIADARENSGNSRTPAIGTENGAGIAAVNGNSLVKSGQQQQKPK